MQRDEIIKRLISLGDVLATEKGYTLISNEINDGGIWGSTLINFLEKEYGNCSKEVKWFKPNEIPENKWGDNFEMRFRFSNPCLSYDQRNIDGSLVEIELSNYNHKTEKHDGEWRIYQYTIFGDNLEYAKRLRDLVVEKVLKG